jgi:hypothetical protein
MDPPVEGSFSGGYGRFLGHDLLGDRPVKVRFIWKDITGQSARFEQAFSYDQGQHWQTNWVITLICEREGGHERRADRHDRPG